jgi:hypothetical protein
VALAKDGATTFFFGQTKFVRAEVQENSLEKKEGSATRRVSSSNLNLVKNSKNGEKISIQ